MVTKIQRWGNSLGLRIPKAFAEETNVDAGSAVDLSVKDGTLVIRPVRDDGYDVRTLVKAITKTNLHAPIDAEPVGKEVW